MSDKSKYTKIEIIKPEYVYIKPNVNVLYETVHEIWKIKFCFPMAAIFNIANKMVEASTYQVASIKILK